MLSQIARFHFFYGRIYIHTHTHTYTHTCMPHISIHSSVNGHLGHFHILCCVLSHFSHVQLFETLWTIALQAPLPMGFSRQECWSGLLCSPPGHLLDSGIDPVSLTSPALAGGFFTTSTTWDAPLHQYIKSKNTQRLTVGSGGCGLWFLLHWWYLPC